jgi:hypothetical protein
MMIKPLRNPLSLLDYIEKIVEPTFNDFHLNPTSERHAFLACVVIYHSVDYASQSTQNRGKITKEWSSSSMEFAIVDLIANHFKHLVSWAETKYMKGTLPEGIPLHSLIFHEESSEKSYGLKLHHVYNCAKEAIHFIKNWSKNEEPVSK